MAVANYNDPRNDSPGAGPAFSEDDSLFALLGVSAAEATAPLQVTRTTPTAPELYGRPGEAGFGGGGGSAPATMEDPGVHGLFGTTLLNFAQGDPKSITQMQQKLYDGGFYETSYYGGSHKAPKWGQPDEDTLGAFTKALRQAALSKRPLEDVIDSAAKEGFGAKQRKAHKKPLTISLSNPQKIASSATKVATEVLGRQLSKSELANFVNSFHSMEAEAQRAKYAAGYDPETGGALETDAEGNPVGTQGGVLTEAPTLDSAYLEQQLRQMDPSSAQAMDLTNATSFIDQLWGGGLTGAR